MDIPICLVSSLRYLLHSHLPPARTPTAGDRVTQMEVSVQSMSMAASLAKRIAQHGGAALIIDYGQDKLQQQSLQAIKKHKFVHPLTLPGEADLSCHVDFSALRQASLQFPRSFKMQNEALQSMRCLKIRDNLVKENRNQHSAL